MNEKELLQENEKLKKELELANKVIEELKFEMAKKEILDYLPLAFLLSKSWHVILYREAIKKGKYIKFLSEINSSSGDVDFLVNEYTFETVVKVINEVYEETQEAYDKEMEKEENE